MWFSHISSVDQDGASVFLVAFFFLEVAGHIFAFDALKVLESYVDDSLVLKQHIMFRKLSSLNTAGGVSVEFDNQFFNSLS